MNDGTTEDYYTRGIVAGHRRVVFLSDSALAESLATAEGLVIFYGEMGMTRLAAYYTGIRDILGDVVDARSDVDAIGFLDDDTDVEFLDDGELGLMWWERLLARVGWPFLAGIGFAAIAAIFYWKAPEF